MLFLAKHVDLHVVVDQVNIHLSHIRRLLLILMVWLAPQILSTVCIQKYEIWTDVFLSYAIMCPFPLPLLRTLVVSSSYMMTTEEQ